MGVERAAEELWGSPRDDGSRQAGNPRWAEHLLMDIAVGSFDLDRARSCYLEVDLRGGIGEPRGE